MREQGPGRGAWARAQQLLLHAATMFSSDRGPQRAVPPPPRDRGGPRFGGEVITLESYRRRLEELRQDAGLDAAWNELLAAAEEAWSWRDPETLRALEACLTRLRAPVLRDWR